jgi:hypothetical protein
VRAVSGNKRVVAVGSVDVSRCEPAVEFQGKCCSSFFLEQTGNVGFGVERCGHTFLPVPLVYRKLNPESIRQTDIFSGNGSFTNVIDGKIETSHPVAIFHAVSTRFLERMDVKLERN